MSQTIELESIRRVDIKPGETLVATLPGTATRQEVEEVRDSLHRLLPDGVKVLVVNSNVDLNVIPCPSVPA
jgi:hypothetical protein